MQALRKVDAGPGLEIAEIPDPVAGPGEVVVEVEAASICGTDLHIKKWDEWSQQRIHPPLTLGHEFAGTVVEIGDDVDHVRVGDFVSAESHITCGMCFQCRTGQAHMCERTKILGVDREGAFARYLAVPESVIWQNDRAKLPPEIATLQEPFGNAVFATSEQDLAGRSVAVHERVADRERRGRPGAGVHRQEGARRLRAGVRGAGGGRRLADRHLPGTETVGPARRGESRARGGGDAVRARTLGEQMSAGGK